MTAAPYRTIEEAGISQIHQHLRTIMWVWWPGVVAVAMVLRIGIAIWDRFDASIWAAAVSVSPVYLSVVGAIAGGLVMPRYIAQGVTRRHFATGALVTMIGCGLIAGIVTMVGFGIEEVIYNLAGIHHVLTDPTVYSSVPHALGVFASYVLLNATYMCAGWTAGVGFYRWGWVGGGLFLPIAILPVTLVEWLVGSEWAWNPAAIVGPARVYLSLPDTIAGDITIPVLVAIIISSAVLVAAMWLHRFIMREISIH